jgi:hypothetical protein
MRFTKAECLIVRLSDLEFMKESLIIAPSRCGREMRPEPECGEGVDLRVLERIEGRFLGAVGACIVLAVFVDMVEFPEKYHD